MVKTIRTTIDEILLREVDAACAASGLNRSAFIREALRQAVTRHRVAQMERQHAAGYARQPVQPGEFDFWEAEQAWENRP